MRDLFSRQFSLGKYYFFVQIAILFLKSFVFGFAFIDIAKGACLLFNRFVHFFSNYTFRAKLVSSAISFGYFASLFLLEGDAGISKNVRVQILNYDLIVLGLSSLVYLVLEAFPSVLKAIFFQKNDIVYFILVICSIFIWIIFGFSEMISFKYHWKITFGTDTIR